MISKPPLIFAVRLREAGVNLAVLMTTVMFTVAVAEIGLWVAGVQVSPSGGGRFIADPRLLYRGDPGFPEHDSRGFRNRDALRRADVVLLGDSHTYGVGVPPDDTWARVLAEETGLVVYNMAFGGWGPRQAAVVLPDALALKPKVVLHGFFFGNDVLDALAAPAPDTAGIPGTATTDAPLPCLEYLPGPVVIRPATGGLAFVSRHSRIYGLVRNLYRTVAPYPAATNDTEAARRLAESDPHDQATWFEGAQWRTVFTAPYRLCALDDSDPRIRAGVEIVLSTLLAMAQDAENAGAALAVVLLPTKESSFAPRVANLGDHEGLAELVAAESRLRDELATVLRANGIAVLDLLPPLRGAPEQPYFVGRTAHPNLFGHRVIGLEAAQRISDLVGGAADR